MVGVRRCLKMMVAKNWGSASNGLVALEFLTGCSVYKVFQKTSAIFTFISGVVKIRCFCISRLFLQKVCQIVRCSLVVYDLHSADVDDVMLLAEGLVLLRK